MIVFCFGFWKFVGLCVSCVFFGVEWLVLVKLLVGVRSMFVVKCVVILDLV